MDDRHPALACPPRTPIAALATAELLVVTTLRLWVAPWRDRSRSHPDWRGGLDAAGLPPSAAAAFDTLLRILAAGARRPLDVRCLRCRELGGDEALHLALTRALQLDRRQAAAAILDLWLAPAAARMAILPAAGFARALGQAGLFIPSRPPSAPLPAPGPHPCADPGALLVH